MSTHAIEVQDDTLFVRLHHSLTHRTGAQFDELLAHLRDSPIRRCVVHMDTLDFIDSQGLGLLLTAGRIAESRALPLRLVRPRGEVKERLDFVRLDELVEIDHET